MKAGNQREGRGREGGGGREGERVGEGGWEGGNPKEAG